MGGMPRTVRTEEAVVAAACVAVLVLVPTEAASFTLHVAVVASRLTAILVFAWLVGTHLLVITRQHGWSEFRPIVPPYDSERLGVLNVCALPIEVFDFERIDEFAIGSPRALCAVYVHPFQYETVSIYNFGGETHRIELEITTRFTNGYTLTTYNGSTRFLEPTQAGQFVQKFGGEARFKTLLAAHLAARRILMAKGLVPVRLEGSIREDMLAAHRERIAHHRSIRFASFKRIDWLRNCPHGGLLENQRIPLSELFPLDQTSWYAKLQPLAVPRVMKPRAVSASELN
jgi:hypothetical protein